MTDSKLQPEQAMRPPEMLRHASTSLGAAVFFGGLITFAGWVLGIYRLTDWTGIGITMKVNASLAAMSTGLGLLILSLLPSRPMWIRSAAGLAAAIGVLTLSQHLLGWNLRLDDLLVREPPGGRATVSPGRMGPPASLSFFLLGTALIFATLPKLRPIAAWLNVATISVSTLSLVGYLYGAELMYSAPRLTGISVQTAFMILASSVGILLRIPDHYPVSVLLERTAAGMLARRLLPIIILLPLALGGLRVAGQDAGLYDTAFGTAMRTVIEMALLAGVLAWAIALLKEYEAAIRRADARKDEFLATLAHELRNPLAPVMNSLELLSRQQLANQHSSAALQAIRRQMSHMVRLVDDLLDVSRISRGKIHLQKQHLELDSILHHAIEMVRPLADAAGHQITVDLPDNPIHLEADAARLTQAFGNILNNACRYSNPRGIISIRVQEEEGKARISIRDQGVGVPPEKLTDIFDLFSQVDRSIERTRGGLGIGLHLVKNLVKLHDGTIDARSDGVGCGMEIIVRLPLTKPLPRTADVPEVKDTPTQSRRILVVDDNVDSARSLAMLLKLSGNITETAFDGHQAVEKTASFRPDAILLDIGLPKLNGYDACRAIRRQPNSQDLLIIALTGWGQEEDRRKSKEAGFDAHLVKPVDHAKLADLLRHKDGTAGNDQLTAIEKGFQREPPHYASNE